MAPSIFGRKPFSRKKVRAQAQPTAPAAPLPQDPPSLPFLTPAHPLPTIDDPQAHANPSENIDPTEIQEILQKCPQFRVLIMGRANSGKTTIIQRMCDTNEDPVVHDEFGNEYPVSVLNDPTAMRGIHDINLQITYKSNPNFKFHDSRGFEAGSIDEIEKVREFIRKKLAETELHLRLHAIWYCIPTDGTRVASEAELSFFKENTGDIPVIVVFTKWDGHIVQACNALENDQDMEFEQAIEEAPRYAKTILDEQYIPIFKNTPYPPAAYAVLGYMDNPETKCGELAEKTAAALNNGVLKRLFVSVQTHNLHLCINGAVNEAICEYQFLKFLGTGWDSAVALMLSWFGHIFVRL